jgi:ATP-dependent Clp protease ATP-binding subunit ClpA
VFERFTDRARHVVVLAQEEARLLNHNYIGTEHILLGLIHDGEGVAAKALESLGISLEAVRSQVEEIIGQGGSSPPGHIPFTPRAKKVLELSLREALQLGHNYIGTEHILLGLIREGEGVAAQVLVKLGADLSRVRQQVIQRLSGYSGQEAAPRDVRASRTRPGPPAPARPHRSPELVADLLRSGEVMRAVTFAALLDLWRDDLESLEDRLGAVTRLAFLSGDTRQLLALRQLVEIIDAEQGVVHLRPRPPHAPP